MRVKNKEQCGSRSSILFSRFYFLDSKKGLTLIELLVSMIILIVIGSFAIVNVANYFTRQALDSEAKLIAATLRSAQEKSMGQDSSSRWGVALKNPVGSGDYYVLFQVDEALVASGLFDDVPGTANDRKKLHGGLQFSAPSEGTNLFIYFEKISGLPSASTSVSLQLISDSAIVKTVSVSANGKIDTE